MTNETSGTKAYERGRTMQRVTATMPTELKSQIDQAASMSGMSVSGYLQALLGQAFPDGLPHFGMAMIGVNGQIMPLGNLSEQEDPKLAA